MFQLGNFSTDELYAELVRREGQRQFHAGLLKIPSDLLRAALHLPEGAIITGARDDLSTWGELVLRIEHPDLPVVGVAQHLPWVSPVLRASDEKTCKAVEFVSWGLGNTGQGWPVPEVVVATETIEKC